MQQKITGFHTDGDHDWVAELACGHFQHVRHNPPWVNRSWVVSAVGREGKLGYLLDCKKCDRNEPPDAAASTEALTGTDTR